MNRQTTPDDKTERAKRDTAAILKKFPDLKAADISACLDYARDLAQFTAAAA